MSDLRHVRRMKLTGHSRLEEGTEWPVYHILEGNKERGYSVSESVCRGVRERTRSYRRLHNAVKYFESLTGEEIE